MSRPTTKLNTLAYLTDRGTRHGHILAYETRLPRGRAAGRIICLVRQLGLSNRYRRVTLRTNKIGDFVQLWWEA